MKRQLNVIFVALLLLGVSYLTFRQYRFNLQTEHYVMGHYHEERCSYWDVEIPALAGSEVAVGKITLKEYKEWMARLKDDKQETCSAKYKWRTFNPESPYSTDWFKHRKQSGLNSFTGYFKDLVSPLIVKEEGIYYVENPEYTVILKDHWYSKEAAECYVTGSSEIPGNPLPFLSRKLYALSCRTPETIKDGIGGFVAVATSSKLELINKGDKK